jgi:hypothetical protein
LGEEGQPYSSFKKRDGYKAAARRGTTTQQLLNSGMTTLQLQEEEGPHSTCKNTAMARQLQGKKKDASHISCKTGDDNTAAARRGKATQHLQEL